MKLKIKIFCLLFFSPAFFSHGYILYDKDAIFEIRKIIDSLEIPPEPVEKPKILPKKKRKSFLDRFIKEALLVESFAIDKEPTINFEKYFIENENSGVLNYAQLSKEIENPFSKLALSTPQKKKEPIKNLFLVNKKKKHKVVSSKTKIQKNAIKAPVMPKNQLVMNKIPKKSQPIVILKNFDATKKFVTLADKEEVVKPQKIKIKGKVTVDEKLETYLDKQKGHFELFLYEEDSQKKVFLPFGFSSPDEFEMDIHAGKRYRLGAVVFVKDQTEPVSEIYHKEIISSDGTKTNIDFKLDYKRFIDFNRPNYERHNLLITIFEAPFGDSMHLKTIPNSEIRLLGTGMEFRSDNDGNVKISNLASNSEYLVQVKANGYYPTEIIVPIHNSVSYQPVYLVPRGHVDVVSNYFTPRHQDINNAVILGKVYDSRTLKGLSNERISMLYEKKGPLYYEIFPNPKREVTSYSGLFGFYNIIPSMRAILRDGKTPFLLNAKNGMAYFLEFNRLGRKALKGKIIDPFEGYYPRCNIKFVGENTPFSYTDDDGEFLFEEVDLVTSLITIEVESKGYPLTWFNTAWDIKNVRNEPKYFYLLSERFLRENVKLEMEGGKGVIIGAIDDIFYNYKGCILPRLLYSNGENVEKEKGPFFLLNDNEPLKCLNRQTPSFIFNNLQSGQYILKFEGNDLLRSKVVNVGINRITIVAN